MCAVCGSPAEAVHWTDYPLAPRGPLSSTGTRLRRAELVTGELWPAVPTSIWAAVIEATAEPDVGVEVDWAGFGVALSAFVYAHRAEYAGAQCRVAGGPTVRILATPTGTGRLDVVAAGPAALTLSPVAAGPAALTLSPVVA